MGGTSKHLNGYVAKVLNTTDIVYGPTLTGSGYTLKVITIFINFNSTAHILTIHPRYGLVLGMDLINNLYLRYIRQRTLTIKIGY